MASSSVYLKLPVSEPEVHSLTTSIQPTVLSPTPAVDYPPSAIPDIFTPRIRHCSSDGNLAGRVFGPDLPLLFSTGTSNFRAPASSVCLYALPGDHPIQHVLQHEFVDGSPGRPKLKVFRLADSLKGNSLTNSFPYGLPSVNIGSSVNAVHWESPSCLSKSTSGIIPICRICHSPGSERDFLISPCRCAGSLQFIHTNCLKKWIEYCSKRSRKSPKCEICHYHFHRHKKFKFKEWHWPRISKLDKCLHICFLLMLLTMIVCAVATVMCFISDRGQTRREPGGAKTELTKEEVITLACGVLFFVSFFVAMTVQIKAKHTVYQLFKKFIMQNMEWEIDQYDKSKDSLYEHTTKTQSGV